MKQKEKDIIPCPSPASSYSQSPHIFQIIDSLFQGFQLGFSIGSIHHNVSTNPNGRAQNGNQPQFFFRYNLVISPSDGRAQKGNIHPRTMIGNEHGRSVLTIKCLELVTSNHFGIGPTESQDEDTPCLTKKDGNPTLSQEKQEECAYSVRNSWVLIATAATAAQKAFVQEYRGIPSYSTDSPWDPPVLGSQSTRVDMT